MNQNGSCAVSLGNHRSCCEVEGGGKGPKPSRSAAKMPSTLESDKQMEPGDWGARNGAEPRKRSGTALDADKNKMISEEPLPARVQPEERLAQMAVELRLKSQELDRRTEQLAEMTSKLIICEQFERQRLAQLLHDDLQQLLVGAKYLLHASACNPADSNNIQAGHALKVLDEAMRVTRSITMHLSPPLPVKLGMAARLRWLAHWMNDLHGLVVELTIDTAADSDREEIRILLFQSVRELLFNVVKHSGVRRAQVELAMLEPGVMMVTVSDKGAGFDPATVWNNRDLNTTGFGLPTIRDRMSLLGGRISILSTTGPACGSRIELVCPLQLASPAPQ